MTKLELEALIDKAVESGIRFVKVENHTPYMPSSDIIHIYPAMTEEKFVINIYEKMESLKENSFRKILQDKKLI